jgi:hypothetical protein
MKFWHFFLLALEALTMTASGGKAQDVKVNQLFILTQFDL